MAVQIEEYSARHTTSVVALVHGILRDEFGFSGPIAEQPDLLDIPRHYGIAFSNFWIALDGNELVGTTGFVDLGDGLGLLRKMFLHSDYRSTGVAQLLLDEVISWARGHGFSKIYLGTNSRFHAAHRFYAKNGFVPLSPDMLPESFPRLDLRDRFYFRGLDQTC